MVNQHPFTQAQALNQSAARLAEIGDYNGAILALTKALELWKTRKHTDDDTYCCFCPHCYSDSKEESSSIVEVNDKEIQSVTAATIGAATRTAAATTTTTTTPRSPLHRSRQDGNNTDQESYKQEKAIGSEYGYLYQELLQIPCRKTFETCNEGSAVALIIIFNLAIVHHLASLTCKMVAKTLRLYELSNDCLETFVNDTHNCYHNRGGFEMGILIQMILVNNLSHLHSFMGNSITSLHCTEKLIPILMCVLDDRVRNIGERPSIFSSTSALGCISLEGFFRNISHLVLAPSQCADAA